MPSFIALALQEIYFRFPQSDDGRTPPSQFIEGVIFGIFRDRIILVNFYIYNFQMNSKKLPYYCLEKVLSLSLDTPNQKYMTLTSDASDTQKTVEQTSHKYSSLNRFIFCRYIFRGASPTTTTSVSTSQINFSYLM